MTADTDLFGNEIDYFLDAKSEFGIWPTTVWECNMQDPKTRALKARIADDGSQRGGGGKSYTKSLYDLGAGYISIFNPAVAAWILNCFAPPEGICFDPFAGGGTRAIMANKHGLKYYGYELRSDEVTAVRKRCAACGADRTEIIQGDARMIAPDIIPDNFADFLYTCPPYWNLEKYDGGPADLSECKSYQGFLSELDKVIEHTFRLLKPGAASCWVVGLHRKDSGEITALNHDVAHMHQRHGFFLKEEIILHLKNNGAIQRVGQFKKGGHRLVRVHEYCLVFIKPE